VAQAIRTIFALLLAAGVLICGNGLQNTLISVRADIEGFPLLLIGLLTSAYFVGFIAGCYRTPALVSAVGHIRTFTALASLASASALAHVIVVEPAVWIALRCVTGFAMAGLYMIIESWINEKSTNANRGQVLSVYRIVDLAGTTVGNGLLALADPASFVLFAVISILVSLSLVPVALTTAIAPQPIATARLDVGKLFAVSPLAAVGSLSVGLANGAFWSVGPVWVQRIGFDVAAVAGFVSAVVIGGALVQWPFGWASDRTDRRYVIILVAAGCVAAAGFLALRPPAGEAALIAGAVAFGVAAMPLFGLCIAHANDRAKPDEYLETNGGLLLMYGAGAVVGPLTATGLMTAYGPAALFLFIAGVYAVLALFGVLRTGVRRGARAADKETWSPVPRTTPAVFELSSAPDETEADGEAAPEAPEPRPA